MAHLQQERLEALAWGHLAGAALREAEDHLASCESCRTRLLQVQEDVPTDHGKTQADLLAAAQSATEGERTRLDLSYGNGPDSQGPTPPPDPEITRVKTQPPRGQPRRGIPTDRPLDPLRDDLPAGTTVGRYVVRRPLAAGSSGRVYVAVDPSLDREVALKLLPLEHGQDSRVLREAHAMARLSHPNVVAIHDVGTFRGAVFLAMELVEGPTLRKWLRAKRRSQREVLDQLVAAGRGLEAAHEAGLIHRDFKPANVLIGPDGRVRVTDFGLARALGAPAANPDGHEKGPLEITLTHAGAVMGTPGYAAPEIVVSGAAADARADQFSFGASMHEALFGVTPYAGEDFGLYFRALTERKRSRVKGGNVPKEVRAVMERALRLKPSDRYESMTALLEDLERVRVRQRRGGRLVLAVVLVAVAGGLAYTTLRRDQDRRKLCRDAGGRLARIWSPEAKATIERAFLATKVRFASDALGIVNANLDEYGRKWTEARTAACESTWVQGRATTDEFIRRVGCLDRQLDELDALLNELGRANGEVVASSPKAISQLPPPERCERESEEVPAPAAPDEATRERARAVRAELARAKAQRALGRYAQGLEVATPATAEARTLGDRGVLAEALTLEASLRYRMGDATQGRELAEEAVWVALGGAEDRLAVAALIQVAVASNLTGDMALAKRVLQQLDHLSARLPADPEREAVIENMRGTIAKHELRNEDAFRHYQRSVAAFEEAVGPDNLQTINPVYNLGALHIAMNQPEKALPYFQRSLQVDEKVLGSNHPDTAWSAAGVAQCLAELGQLEEARRLLRGALAVHEEVLGSDHFLTGQDLYWLGALELELGNPDEAMDALVRALGINRRLGNPGLTASVEETVGRVQLRKGRFDEAHDSFERARAAAVGGPEGPRAVSAMAGLAVALLGQGQKSQALALAEKAASVTGASSMSAAEAKWALARAMVALGKDRASARALALEARAVFQRPGTPRPEFVDIDAWLKKRGGPAE